MAKSQKNFVLLVIFLISVIFLYNMWAGPGRSIYGAEEYGRLTLQRTKIEDTLVGQQALLKHDGEEMNKRSAICALMYNRDFNSWYVRYVPIQFWYKFEMELEKRKHLIGEIQEGRKATVGRGQCPEADQWSRRLLDRL